MLRSIALAARHLTALLCGAAAFVASSAPSLAQSGATGVQGASPNGDQYGVNFDGTGGGGCGQVGPVLAHNPEQTATPTVEQIGEVVLSTGAVAEGGVSSYLPADQAWPISESYNLLQSAGVNDEYQGSGWFQGSQMELVDDTANGFVHLVYAADKYVTYQQVGSSVAYAAIGGAGGCLKFEEVAEAEDMWVLTDMRGVEYTFIGFDEGDVSGQLWKIETPGSGAAAYVGDPDTIAEARSAGGWTSGKIHYAYDSSGRKFTYDYTSGRLDSVIVTLGATEIERVEYTYHDGTHASAGLSGTDIVLGSDGDLRTVTVTTPLSEAETSLVRTRYYRYWGDDGYNSSTHPGFPHAIKLVLGYEGARRYDWEDDATFNETFDLDAFDVAPTDASLKPYAAAYYEYSGTQQVRSAIFNGQCGCAGGGASGVHTFVYQVNSHFSGSSSYDSGDEDWLRRVVVGRPDGSYITQYFDEEAQPLSVVISDGNPADTSPAPTYWVTKVRRNDFGHLVELWMADSIDTYTHDDSGLIPAGAIELDTSGDGLVRLYGRDVSTDAIGYLTQRGWCKASDYASGPKYLEDALTWDVTSATKTVASAIFSRPLLGSRRVFAESNVSWGTLTGGYLTSYDYWTYATSGQPFAVSESKESLPVISTGKNGSGAAHYVYRLFRPDGQQTFRSERTLEETDRQIIERRTYTANAQLEAVYSDSSVGSAAPSTGSEFYVATGASNDLESFEYDDQGRVQTHVTHDGRTSYNYWSQLADRRVVSLQFPNYTPASAGPPAVPTRFYVPAKYSVANHAGGVELEGVACDVDETTIDDSFFVSNLSIAGFVDESNDDPIEALGDGEYLGDLKQVRATDYDSSGSRSTESRVYFLTPASGVGTDGTNYDATLYAYDGMGRRIRTVEPHGTIYRNAYDARGLMTQSWIGKDDTGLPGSTLSGTSDMVQTDATTYDLNGRVTTQTAYTESTTGSGARTATYHLDVRGRAVATVHPTAPHSVRGFDNMGRVIASAEYSSSSGLDAGSLPSETPNRMALSDTSYDERGRVWKTTLHRIDPADGSADDSLDVLYWYDEIGRSMKVDGEQLVKYRYDRLHQRTHEFVLASDNDTTYAHVADVYASSSPLAGDIVLEEHQTAYDGSHHVWMRVAIARLYNDVGGSPTYGPLDSNSDGNLNILTDTNVPKGRVQITSYWYDEFLREEARAEYGTNHGSDNVATFSRTAVGDTVASPSNDVLVTATEYTKDGLAWRITDPKEIEHVYEYDDAGRKTVEIANYADGTPGGGASGDEDQTVRYAYTDGLMTTLTADLPSPETDQVTTYTYGVTKGTSPGDSTITAGDVLQKVTYPDSEDSDDVVRFAYNTQGQLIWRKDQAGNIIEASYDAAGRREGLSAAAVATTPYALDDDVLRIGGAYDALGRIETVTQYDIPSADPMHIIDQVKFVYDGWGNLTKFRQDQDSAVGAGGGSLPTEDVEYTYEKATTGRNTLRRTSTTLPDGAEYVFGYSTATSYDGVASRVTSMQDDVSTDLVTYRYNGVGHLVSTNLTEPEIYSSLYGASGHSFTSLDRFNRTIASKWTKDLTTDVDFLSVAVGYDRNSNVTYQDDLIYGGLDVLYGVDDLNRVTRAHEGTLSSGSITSPTRDQQWTLSQTGNWSRDKVDLNGDADFSDTGEVDDTRAHNVANELQSRDTNNSTPAEFYLSYDAVGNMTNDGGGSKGYKYEWDVFGRLRRVRNAGDDGLISEYWYNGLGYMITRQQDTDGTGKVESGFDKKYRTYYDERWRPVATYREDDDLPKEQFLYHYAGAGGYGGSSYIDLVVFRDKDVSTEWDEEADRLDNRAYYCQNWRADVVVIVDEHGEIQEGARYSAYGVPFGVPRGDVQGDGACEAADLSQVQTWITNSAYDVRGDFNLDGVVDGKDETVASDNIGASHGRGVLSDIHFGNRKGYAGYEGDAKLAAKWHVRNRVFDSALGRWLSRDPSGYVDGASLLNYTAGQPVSGADPTGLETYGYWDCYAKALAAKAACMEEKGMMLGGSSECNQEFEDRMIRCRTLRRYGELEGYDECTAWQPIATQTPFGSTPIWISIGDPTPVVVDSGATTSTGGRSSGGSGGGTITEGGGGWGGWSWQKILVLGGGAVVEGTAESLIPAWLSTGCEAILQLGGGLFVMPYIPSPRFVPAGPPQPGA